MHGGAQHDALSFWLCMLLVLVTSKIYAVSAPMGAACLLCLFPLYPAALTFQRLDNERCAPACCPERLHVCGAESPGLPARNACGSPGARQAQSCVLRAAWAGLQTLNPTCRAQVHALA